MLEEVNGRGPVDEVGIEIMWCCRCWMVLVTTVSFTQQNRYTEQRQNGVMKVASLCGVTNVKQKLR